MNHTFKDGYREGVLFLFYKDGKILIEKRPNKQGDFDVFFPNGSIEQKDKSDENYILNALHREIDEELQGFITVKELVDLGEMEVDAINVLFYIYVIMDYHGTMPSVIKEEGEPDAHLEWINLNDYKNYLVYDSAHEICERLINYVKN